MRTASWFLGLAAVSAAALTLVPTEEWQVIEDGMSIPPGLYVRMNLETGLKEAKLMDGETQEDSQLVVLDPENGQIKKTEETFKDKQFVSRPYTPKPNWRLSRDEHDQFNSAIAILTSNSAPDTAIIESLRALEELAHEMEFGVRVASPAPLKSLMTIISTSSDPAMRRLAAMVVGSAVQNNPPALDEAASSRTVAQLLKAIEGESEPEVQRRLVYALSSSMHHPRSLQEYRTHHGSEILRGLEHDGQLLGKIATLVEDRLADNAMGVDEDAKMVQQNGALLKDVQSNDETSKWCKYFESSLRHTSVSAEEQGKIESVIEALSRC